MTGIGASNDDQCTLFDIRAPNDDQCTLFDIGAPNDDQRGLTMAFWPRQRVTHRAGLSPISPWIDTMIDTSGFPRLLSRGAD